MSDSVAILVSNFTQALSQVNTYIALGITASISAFALEYRKQKQGDRESITVMGALVPLSPDAAKLVLVAVCFAVGIMAAYAAQSATVIAQLLKRDVEILNAVCTFPSVATAPIGVRLIASALPVLFFSLMLLRTWSSIRERDPHEPWGGFISLIGVMLIPYGVLGLALYRLPCNQ